MTVPAADGPSAPTGPRAARALHALVAAVTAVAVGWQLVLVVTGAAVLVETDVPPLATRLVRFVSYFTVESNLLVLGTALALTVDPVRDGRLWRVLRMNAVVGITVTGVVHWFLLRPILDLAGASMVVDALLHVVVPVLAVGVSVVAGPRGQATGAQVLPALAWPALWAGYTLGAGAVTGWYPYPFLDPADLGYPRVLVTVAGIAALLAALLAAVSVAMVGADRGLTRLAARRGPGRR